MKGMDWISFLFVPSDSF